MSKNLNLILILLQKGEIDMKLNTIVKLTIACLVVSQGLHAMQPIFAKTTSSRVYTVDPYANTVSVTDSGTKIAIISVGHEPTSIAITPDEKTAYVTNQGDNTVTPIDLATNTPGTPIPVGKAPTRISIDPDGKTAYVTNAGDDTVTPIDLATNTAGMPIPEAPLAPMPALLGTNSEKTESKTN